jgi:hypothetical protein
MAVKQQAIAVKQHAIAEQQHSGSMDAQQQMQM